MSDSYFGRQQYVIYCSHTPSADCNISHIAVGLSSYLIHNPHPSRYLSSDCSVEEKHSQRKNFNFSFVLFSMEGNQTSVIKSSDGDIKKLMASAVPESTKRSLKYAVNVFEGGESHE